MWSCASRSRTAKFPPVRSRIKSPAARLKYVRNPQQSRTAQDKNPEFSMNNTVRSVRALYRTDAAIASALLPKPLEPGEPNIFVQFANVCMHIPNAEPVTVNAATVGV